MSIMLFPILHSWVLFVMEWNLPIAKGALEKNSLRDHDNIQ